jgi:cytochrome c-type biogenesis protein CcsB
MSEEMTISLIAYLCLWGAMVLYGAELLRGYKSLGRLAPWTSLASLLILTVALVLRAIQGGHWPFTSTYEFSLVFVWGIVFIWLLMERGLGRVGGAFILPLAVALYTYAFLLPPSAKEIRPLVPALRSIWLQLHVGSSIAAYGAFAAACGLGAMYLVKGQKVASQLPSWEQIDRYIWRAVALGFPAMTLVLLTGAIWAQVAWGDYWSWDPKETWTLITWLIYLLFLHGRLLRSWRGRPLAVLAICGFLSVLFTFLGLGWVVRRVQLESLHVF